MLQRGDGPEIPHMDDATSSLSSSRAFHSFNFPYFPSIPFYLSTSTSLTKEKGNPAHFDSGEGLTGPKRQWTESMT